MAVWYVDTSVALRALLDRSRSAADWFDEHTALDQTLTSSRLLELEMVRALRRESLDPAWADEFLKDFTLTRVDNALLQEAAAIRPHVRSLDAIHLASAQRIGTARATVVTHNATMARVADALGFDVHDPVV